MTSRRAGPAPEADGGRHGAAAPSDHAPPAASPVIDLHTHLLPAVDDGARTASQALDALGRLAATGVRVVACTPHLRASAVALRMRRGGAAEPARTVGRHDASLAALAAAAPAGLTLVHGWEIMLDEPGVALDDPALALGDSRALLVEFPHGALPPNAGHELERLRASGVVPIVAHPERYGGMTPELAADWRARGAVLQGDATYLCGTGPRARLARALLAAGQLDLLASDNHGDARTQAVAREFLVARDAADVARLLTEVNPARLLRDEPPLPVPPTVAVEGAWGELRAWLHQRLRAHRGPPGAARRAAAAGPEAPAP